MGKRRLGLVAAAAATALAAGVAYAAIPGPGGVIHGCYAKKLGALRVIDAETEKCTSRELAIQWNQKGPEGPPGPPGTFSGTFASPNGQFSLSVTDQGIELEGPAARVTIGAAGVSVVGASSVSLNGGRVELNSCGAPVGRLGDSVAGAGSNGIFVGTITSGSPTVCAG